MQILSYGYQSIQGHSNSETMMAGRRKCNDCDDYYDEDECEDFNCPLEDWDPCDDDSCDCHCEYDD